ncbi:nucleoside phosphorylase domain-containing protein [Trichoderma sp. SZMC 28014]
MTQALATPYSRDDYTVGWVCALPTELSAAIYMLDKRHPDLKQPRGDFNAYVLGKIGEHNTVMAGLPIERTGTASTATVAAQMISSFPNIRLGIMVGIGSGIPQKVQLGDVVISTPVNDQPGVLQWDMDIAEDKGFIQTGSLNPQGKPLLESLAKLEAEQTETYITAMKYLRQVPKGYFQTPQPKDIAYDSSYQHIGGDNCSQCNEEMAMKRDLKSQERYKLQFGLVASGNQVIKSAEQRDKLYRQFEDILCIETELAGLMNDFSCIVVRGISDYADSHKTIAWQEYAAAAAAVYAKIFLEILPVCELDKLESVKSLTPPGSWEGWDSELLALILVF